MIQNGCHFADSIFKLISMNENHCILILISQKFVPNGPVYNEPTLVQIMACQTNRRHSGDCKIKRIHLKISFVCLWCQNVFFNAVWKKKIPVLKGKVMCNSKIGSLFWHPVTSNFPNCCHWLGDLKYQIELLLWNTSSFMNKCSA